jgi:hypothetical protein
MRRKSLQKSWSRRRKRSPLLEDWGFLRYWLWEEEGVRCVEEPIRGEIK